MTEINPCFLRQQRHEVILDFFRVGLFRQSHAECEAFHMGIHDDAGYQPKRRAQDDIRCLASHPRKTQHLVHRFRDSSVEITDEYFAESSNGLGFVAKETGRANIRFQFFNRYGQIVFRFAIFLEERFRDFVDAHIGALRGKNRSDQKLKRSLMMKRRGRIGIRFSQMPPYLFRACLFVVGLFLFRQIFLQHRGDREYREAPFHSDLER